MVSIIIPVYNTEKYIAETINSVLNQSFNDWELIVIDDGSVDNSANIIQELAIKDNRISYNYQSNMGVSIARNNGIKKAKGNFVFFLDADDIWKPDNLGMRIKTFQENNDIDWLFGSIELVDENSNKLNSIITGSDLNILNSLLTWNGDVITTPSTICVRTKCLTDTKFDPDLSTAADQDFAIQLASKYKGKYIDSAMVLYRTLPNSMSRNIATMEKDHIKVYKKAAKNNLFNSFWIRQKCFSNLYWILAGSWWKNGNNKFKGMHFIILALINNPFSIFRFFDPSKK